MNDWQEELRNSVHTREQLEQYITLTAQERKGIEAIKRMSSIGE